MPEASSVEPAIATLQHLAELLQVRRSQLAAEVGLTARQWHVLEQISTEHFMPSLFARERECTPANISKTLRQLQDKKLISVGVSAADGRQREYSLTVRGRETMARLRRNRQQAIDAIWGRLDAADLDAFTRVGSELAGLLEAYAAAH